MARGCFDDTGEPPMDGDSFAVKPGRLIVVDRVRYEPMDRGRFPFQALH